MDEDAWLTTVLVLALLFAAFMIGMLVLENCT